MIRDIPLTQIDESPSNPRRTFTDLSELTESIREKGVLSPILVRPQGDRFEVVFGHRRFRAAKLALLSSIPAMIRELDDRQVLEAQVVENSQRSDVHPLEEAEALQALHKRHGIEVDELAARLGKSLSYVYGRLRLCDLVEDARTAFLEGKWNASVALLVARLPSRAQQQAATESLLAWDTPTVANARQVTRSLLMRLAEAPFDIAASDLIPSAGPCTTCPKRSAAQAALFEDLLGDDRCLDSVCFKAKIDEAWNRRLTAARKEGWQVLDDESGAREVFAYGGYVGPWSGYVDLDAPYDGQQGSPTWREKLGNPEPILVRSPTGHAVELGHRPASISTVKHGEAIDPEAEARLAREREERRLQYETSEAFEKLGRPLLEEAVAGALVSVHELILPLLAVDLIESMDLDQITLLAGGLGINLDEEKRWEAVSEIERRLMEVDLDVLANVVAAETVRRAWGWDCGEDGPCAPVVIQALEGFGIDVPELKAKAGQAARQKQEEAPDAA